MAVPVLIAPGLAVAPEVRVDCEDFDGFDLRLAVVAVPADGARAGHFECRQLEVRRRSGGPPVTTESLRSISLAGIIKRAAAGYVMRVDDTGGVGTTATSVNVSDQEIDRLREAGPTTETLAMVAYIYRLALVIGESPTKMVESWLQIPRSTAGRWVAAARSSGQLGTAEGPGRAGG